MPIATVISSFSQGVFFAAGTWQTARAVAQVTSPATAAITIYKVTKPKRRTFEELEVRRGWPPARFQLPIPADLSANSGTRGAEMPGLEMVMDDLSEKKAREKLQHNGFSWLLDEFISQLDTQTGKN
jgi:hypothetical protein